VAGNYGLKSCRSGVTGAKGLQEEALNITKKSASSLGFEDVTYYYCFLLPKRFKNYGKKYSWP
jgi:hypothetical protein